MYSASTLSTRSPMRTMADFEIGKILGEGAFGVVYMARIKEHNFLCAIKVMKKKEILSTGADLEVVREIELHAQLHHPNIIRMFSWFHDGENICMVQELVPCGDVYGKLKAVGKFGEAQAASYTYDVANALHYCHERQVLHRDIKPENLLLGAGGEVKLADFGLSVRSRSDKRSTRCGTLDYLAPEKVAGKPYGKSSDAWALGVLIYEFLVGHPPFEHPKEMETFAAIASATFVFPGHINRGPRDLIGKLLRVVPQSRLSVDQVATHSWIRTAKGATSSK